MFVTRPGSRPRISWASAVDNASPPSIRCCTLPRASRSAGSATSIAASDGVHWRWVTPCLATSAATVSLAGSISGSLLGLSATGAPVRAESTRCLASRRRSSERSARSVSTPKSMRQATSSTPDGRHPLDDVGDVGRRAEQPARRQVPLGCHLEQLVHLLGRQRLEQVIGVLAPTGERRERRGDVTQQADRGAEVRLHRLARRLPCCIGVAVEVRVHHQRDAAVARMAGLAPRGAVALEVLGELLDRLAEQVREHVDAQRPGALERRRRPGRREPHRELGLHGARQRVDLDRVAVVPGQAHRLATPEALHGVDPLRQILLGRRVGARVEHEVVGLPAGCERDADTAARDVVDHRPLLGDPDGRVQREHDAAGADRHVLRDRGERGAGHARVRIGTAERVEVALGRPHRLEPVGVGEPCAVEQQAIAVGRGVLAGREVEQAERDRAGAGRRGGGQVPVLRSGSRGRP